MKTLILTAAVCLLSASVVFASDAESQVTPRCGLKTDDYSPIVPGSGNPSSQNDTIKDDLAGGAGGNFGEETEEDDNASEPAEVSGAFNFADGEVEGSDEVATPPQDLPITGTLLVYDNEIVDSEDDNANEPAEVSGAFLV